MKGRVSNFLKCDLHLHSGTGNDRSYSNEDFIQKIKQTDLDVVAITDHNIINKDVYRRLENETNKNIILGIEMNVSLSDKVIEDYSLDVKSNYFHALLWFDYGEIDEIHDRLIDLLETKGIKRKDEDINYKDLMKRTDGYDFKLDDVQSTFDNYRFYFIPHEDNSERAISKYLPNSSRKNQQFKAKLFYYNSNFAIEGKDHKIIIEYLDSKHHFRLCDVYFSDAKTIEEIGERYTWINFTGEFNGLILPFSDSEKRVIKSTDSTDNPQKNNKNYLEEITFTVNGKTHSLSFSPGLNGIIGSRGSGKSLLASIIANDYRAYEGFSIEDIMYRMKDSDFSPSRPKIKYIYQGYLSTLYEKRNYTQIDYINDIKGKVIKQKQADIEKILDSIENRFNKINTNISDFVKKELYKPDFNNIVKYTADNNLIKSSSEIWSYKFSEIDDTREHIKKIIRNIESLSESIIKTPNFRLFSEQKDINLNLNKIKKKSLSHITNIEKDFRSILDEMSKEKFKKNTKLRELFLNHLRVKIDNYNAEINNRETQLINNYNNSLGYLKSLLDLRLSVKIKMDEIHDLYEKILNENTEHSFDMNGEEVKLFTSLDETLPLDEHYKTVFNIENLGSKLEDNLWKWAVYDYEKYYNKRKIRKDKERLEVLESAFNKIFDSIQSVKDIDVKMTYNNKELSQYSPGKQAEILLKIILEKELPTETEISKIIILDQPEDNLDTDTIVDRLVKKIRDIKLHNQLFIVSHSAPVIINGDSDLIIHCESNVTDTDSDVQKKSDLKTIFTFNQGNINNKEMRNRIVKVLDGGEKYLKMRVNKYDFRFKEGDS
ncbi:MAG: PHP domain-containing protein [archaeon]